MRVCVCACVRVCVCACVRVLLLYFVIVVGLVSASVVMYYVYVV